MHFKHLFGLVRSRYDAQDTCDRMGTTISATCSDMAGRAARITPQIMAVVELRFRDPQNGEQASLWRGVASYGGALRNL